MRLIAALRARARDERGFTMVTVMTVMFCVTLLSIAALSAAQNDLKPGAHDTSRKVAYAAAEAGVQNYLFHLSEDLDYWAKCTTGAGPHAVNNPWNGTSPAVDPRTWRSLPNSNARYTIELLPANGAAACSTADPETTLIDAASGTFKIRATGENRADGVKRSIITTFKKRSLLDYLYLSDKETLSPDLYAIYAPGSEEDGTSPVRDLRGWAAASCDRYWGADPAMGQRGAAGFVGRVQDADGNWTHTTQPFTCVELGFASNEPVAGPLHTNDKIKNDRDCPTPALGTSWYDAIETSSLGEPATTAPAANDGFRIPCGDNAAESRVNYSTTPLNARRPYGMALPRSPSLQLPLSNDALLAETDEDYRFRGPTKIVMSGTAMHVQGTRMNGTTVNGTVPIPADGVIYVANNNDIGFCPAYTPANSAAAPPACGNLEVEGNYAANITLTAENDIVLTNNLQRTASGSPFLLGLIATNYVRVAHPVTGCRPALQCNKVTGCSDAAGTNLNVSVEGAILSLTRSFIVDNWFCGGQQGTLSVYGAIAQKFHGPVGDLPKQSGYFKAFTYDTKLRYRSPPHFLDPVNAQWRIGTFSEQVPAR
jgi:hypothetical protein